MLRGKIILIVVIVCLFTSQIKSIWTQDKIEPEYAPGELLVRFAPTSRGEQLDAESKNAILSSLGGAIIEHNFKVIPGLSLIKLPNNQTVKDTLEVYNSMEGILYAEPNYKLEIFEKTPNDPCFVEQWGLHNVGQDPPGGLTDADIDAPAAWDIRTNADPNIIVAVIDTGVDYTHPDLADNMWINELEYYGMPGVDDDGKGYIDDIYGYDFCTYGFGKIRDSDPFDDSTNGHGTHIAGIIGAMGNNEEGITGVCWNVKMMAIKSFNFSGQGYVDDAIASIEYAILMNAKIINASWGFRHWDIYDEIASLREVIEQIDEAGIILVASAGNDCHGIDPVYFPVYPAVYETGNIITVMATDPCDLKCGFSNSGSQSVDLAAPGVGILSCLPGNDYGLLSGTSMASGFVSGACALVWSQWPTLTHYEVKEVILESVDELDSLSGMCVTEGRLNLYNALTYKPPLMVVSKEDGVDPNEYEGFWPGDVIEYVIRYGSNGYDHEDIVVVDYLPAEVDFYAAYPDDGVCDPCAHTYTWEVGALGKDDPAGQVVLYVKMTDRAAPLTQVENWVEVESDISFSTASEITPVGPWGDIFYVDVDATGDANGLSWEHAFNHLEDAIAEAGYCDQIWVAAGVYQPEPNEITEIYQPFMMKPYVRWYGGF